MSNVIKKFTPKFSDQDVDGEIVNLKNHFICDGTKDFLKNDLEPEKKKKFMEVYTQTFDYLRSDFFFHPEMDTALKLILPENTKERNLFKAKRYATIAHNVAYLHVRDRTE